MKRLMTAAAIAAALALAAAPATAKNVLKWASQGDALTADPHSQNEGPTNAATLQIYETLVFRDPNMKLIPALATSWGTLKGKPTVWEFKLRKGVKFHDGSPMTADDVVFSFNRAKMKTSDFKGYLASVTEIKKIDSHTIHLITKGPNPILPNQMTQVAIMSQAWAKKHKVEKPQDFKAGEENYAARNANGTGPFMLKLREPGVRTILVRNKNWWGWKQAGGNVDEVHYTPIKNAATRVAALLSGQVDFVLDPPFQDLGRIQRSANLKVVQTPQIRTIFLGLDTGVKELRTSNVKGKNPFADRRVREAMYRAIDIAAIQKVVMRGLAVPAGIITSPGVNGYNGNLNKRLAYDPKKAKELLTAAGYPNGFSVRLDCPNNRYNNDEKICIAVVGMLGKIGIKVNLDAIPKSKHFPKIQKRVSDFYMLGWGVPTLDSHYVFTYLYRSKGPWNATGFKNPRVDELTAAMPVTVDLKKRDAMIAEAWKIAKDAIVYIPLHHQVIAWGMSKKVTLPIRADDSPHFRWAKVSK